MEGFYSDIAGVKLMPTDFNNGCVGREDVVINSQGSLT